MRGLIFLFFDSSSPQPTCRIGIMGLAMARNLIKAGYEVHVWNRDASKCKELVSEGAKVGWEHATFLLAILCQPKINLWSSHPRRCKAGATALSICVSNAVPPLQKQATHPLTVLV
jgi:glycerol-3-phosphate dehydrogenase